ncbi:hypothetical protein [Caballeronia glebae]|uniref:hypothetical protein n=1 Tax=Caballeronia glebae TaxID=1777143 RepID=UPI0038B8D5F2
MQLPIKADLARRAQSGDGIVFCSGDYSLNPNRRVYKYYWQVFTDDSEWEGAEFFQNTPKLSIAAYRDLVGRLQREGKAAFVYNTKRLRQGHGLPLDMNHARWSSAVLAPSLDDDMDPEYDGYK